MSDKYAKAVAEKYPNVRASIPIYCVDMPTPKDEPRLSVVRPSGADRGMVFLVTPNGIRYEVNAKDLISAIKDCSE